MNNCRSVTVKCIEILKKEVDIEVISGGVM